MGKSRGDLTSLYSEILLSRRGVFSDALKELAPRHPRVAVTVTVVTKGNTTEIHHKVLRKARGLQPLFAEFLPECSMQARFLGARELLEIARRQPSYTLSLRFAEGPISTESSYVVLVNLKDYFSFITDDSGSLRRYIFEWNVRDYQGNVEVNADIERTLADASAPEFWWLNNGITVVASGASITGKVVALDDVQIVNGLQTSVVIYQHIKTDPAVHEKRTLLCRIIVTGDALTRDRVIKATNFQTAVSPASLKATDPIQRDIEQFFYLNNWYYDRRKNHYKNLGKPAEKIIGIPYLAQAIMAMGLGEPDNSRARPTSLIKDDDVSRRVFDSAIALSVYLWAAVAMKKVDSFMRGDSAPGNEVERREFRFHVAALLVAGRLKRWPSDPQDLAALVASPIQTSEMTTAMDCLLAAVCAFPNTANWPLDRIAKSPDFVNHLRKLNFAGGCPTQAAAGG